VALVRCLGRAWAKGGGFGKALAQTLWKGGNGVKAGQNMVARRGLLRTARHSVNNLYTAGLSDG